MMKTKIIIITAFFVVFFNALSLPFEAAAQENSCQIKAGLDNVHVYVRDFDRDGNPTRRVIYRGWILRGRTIAIKSFSGRISVSYRADSDYRGSGNNELSCTRNRVFILP